jgi:hypothetical protein
MLESPAVHCINLHASPRMPRIESSLCVSHLTVGLFWSVKHTMNLMNQRRSEWFNDDVEASTEFFSITSDAAAQSSSQLLRECGTSHYVALRSARMLTSLTRGSVTSLRVEPLHTLLSTPLLFTPLLFTHPLTVSSLRCPSSSTVGCLLLQALPSSFAV